MRKKPGIIIVALVTLLVAGLLWPVLHPREPMFHGKPESFWLYGLTNTFNPALVSAWSAHQRTWNEFGPEAVPLLVKAMQLQESPAQKAYSKYWNKLPARAQNLLPAPVNYSQIRIGALIMLNSVGRRHRVPLPPLVQALEDSHWEMRMNALSCLGNNVLPTLGPEKEKLLPALIRAMNDSHTEVRMNAAATLQYFPSNAQTVVPVLTKALNERDADIRIRAAVSLNKIDPQLAAKAGVVAVAADALKSNGPFRSAHLAAKFLKELSKDSSSAIPALMGGLENGKDPTVRQLSAATLGEIGHPAHEAVPALLRAVREDPSIGVRAASSNALLTIDFEVPQKADPN
ncbi:HEAT repeat domain-containing protein [Pedosphaera parvula]|nr:HEAT repeat domain-containing protein [Pedosphaera parvula]